MLHFYTVNPESCAKHVQCDAVLCVEIHSFPTSYL